MADLGKKIVAKYKDGGIGQDGNPADIITTAFVGCDGVRYKVAIIDNALYVNDARMQSNEDSPCEYAGNCKGGNQNCSREFRNLKGPADERCQIYNERKDAEEEEAKLKELESKR